MHNQVDVLIAELQKTFDEYSDDLGIFSLDESGVSIEIKTKSSEYSYNLEQLKKLYYSPRKKPDTDKAIFRLSSIGIIDDYTVDYNKNCYKIRTLKKTDDEYKEALAKFMLKYYSSNRVKDEMKKVDQAEGNTILKKCLSFLTNFVYEEIAKKRKYAIDIMISACEEGLLENGNEKLKDYIYLYFNSKYARKNYTYSPRLDRDENEVKASLLDDVSNKNYDFNLVWKYIKAVNEDSSGGHIDNSKHLRGATLLLLRDNDDNGALHLLKVFSLFVIGLKDNPNLVTEAKDGLILGFKLFRDNENINFTFKELSENIKKYKEKK